MKITTALASALALAVAMDTTTTAQTTAPKACTAIGYICPKTYAPVCGTNGRTYDTACDLESVQCENDGLKVKATGPCYTCKTTACPATRDPVCGSDRKTYDNECALVLAKCSGVDVAREYFGACANATGSGSSDDGFVTINCATLACTKHSQDANGAVCGSDNKTYDDDCALRRAMCATKTLRKAYDGACPNATTGAPSSNNNSSSTPPSASVVGTAAPNATKSPDSAAVAQSASSLVAALATAVVAVALATN